MKKTQSSKCNISTQYYLYYEEKSDYTMGGEQKLNKEHVKRARDQSDHKNPLKPSFVWNLHAYWIMEWIVFEGFGSNHKLLPISGLSCCGMIWNGTTRSCGIANHASSLTRHVPKLVFSCSGYVSCAITMSFETAMYNMTGGCNVSSRSHCRVVKKHKSIVVWKIKKTI